MPLLAHASKWVFMLTLPLERLFWRTDQYCWKVEVPSIDGWLVRVLCAILYEEPSAVTVPLFCDCDDGSYVPKFSTT
jgi:hypothetical protein